MAYLSYWLIIIGCIVCMILFVIKQKIHYALICLALIFANLIIYPPSSSSREDKYHICSNCSAEVDTPYCGQCGTLISNQENSSSYIPETTQSPR